MGSLLSQQGCLRVSIDQGLVEREHLEVGKEYLFRKDGHRLYMLDTPIELVTDDWRAIARIKIVEVTIGYNETKGIFTVLKIYSDEEAKIVSGTMIPYDGFEKLF